MNQLENLEIKTINHLGIIAGIIDEIGIVEIINEQLGTHAEEIVSPGIMLKATILNGLGFVSQPLYLFPKFFEDKATEHLLGKDNQVKVLKEIPIKITHGYSRDHRPDLKQFILNMIVSGDGDVPIFIETGSGNQSDKKVFGEIAKKYQKQLKCETTIVSDSALYSENNLKLMKGISWVARVPLSIKEAQELVSNLAEDKLKESAISGYRYQEIQSNYAGIKQRWLVVESQKRKESALKKLEEKIPKEYQAISRKLSQLSAKKLSSELEANLLLKQLTSKLKYHQIWEIAITEKIDKQQKINYQITGVIKPDTDNIATLKRKAGRFIIATNKLDVDSFSSDDLLRKYKEQQAPERGFAFLKDPLFFADSVFLKTPRRIETMAMIMGLCLLVYSLGQRAIRSALQTAKTGLKNQLGKLTERPSLRWIS